MPMQPDDDIIATGAKIVNVYTYATLTLFMPLTCRNSDEASCKYEQYILTGRAAFSPKTLSITLQITA